MPVLAFLAAAGLALLALLFVADSMLEDSRLRSSPVVASVCQSDGIKTR